MTKNLPLHEFPSLFQMEAHTGAFGLMFATFWFAIVAFYVPSTVTSYWFFAVAINGAFFLLLWLSFFLADRFAWSMSDTAYTKTDSYDQYRLETRGRRWIAYLSASYAIIFSVLIWLTGGVRSPFVLFYVLIFTLTISKMKFTYRTVLVACCFVFAILFACIAREFWSWPFSQTELAYIQESNLQILIQLLFICASLLVPMFSSYLINLKSPGHFLEQIQKKPYDQDG